MYSHFAYLCHLSDAFPIQNCLKQDFILQLLFHFAVKYAINPLNAELNPICHLLALLAVRPILHISRIRVKKVQANNEGLKLKGVHNLLIYADYVNLLGEKIHRRDGRTLEQGALMNKLNILPSFRTC
jgi:hypothetical protein